MYDILSVLQEEVTKTATAQGPAFDMGPGYPNERLAVRVLFKDAETASGTGTATFTIEHSDNGTNWFLHTSGAADAVSLTTAEKSGELFIPVSTKKKYIRLVCTISGGTDPTITYSGEIGKSIP